VCRATTHLLDRCFDAHPDVPVLRGRRDDKAKVVSFLRARRSGAP